MGDRSARYMVATTYPGVGGTPGPSVQHDEIGGLKIPPTQQQTLTTHSHVSTTTIFDAIRAGRLLLGTGVIRWNVPAPEPDPEPDPVDRVEDVWF
jgi:hypothetical protein